MSEEASSRVWDAARLEQLFAGRGLDWVVERIRQRLERGAGLTGTISLPDPSTEQRAAYARLMGCLLYTSPSPRRGRLDRTLPRGPSPCQ